MIQIFKHKAAAWMMLGTMMLASACSNTDTVETGAVDNIPDGIVIADKYLSEGITIAKSGADVTINVQSRGDVIATSDQEWCGVEKGVKTTAMQVTPIKVKVGENPTTDDRSATINLSAGSDSKQIKVTQVAKDGLIIKTGTVEVPAGGGQFNVELQTNGECEKTISDSWVSVATRASMQDVTDTYVAQANVTSSARSTKITYTLGTLSEAVTVNQAAGNTSSMSLTAKELASLMTAGINIGNTMECPASAGEGAWSGTKVNQDYIRALKAAGFNAVRIPCAWHSYIVDDKMTVSSDWMNRVYEVVNWCVSEGMYVVLNSHWDGGWLEDNIFDASKEDAIVAEQKAIWKQIAEKFEGFDEHLLFAACNEPGMNETTGGVRSWSDETVGRVVKFEQAMIDAVRATGGNNAARCLVIQGLGTDITNTDEHMNQMPTDNVADRLMVEVHFYEPYQFCLMEEDASWGNVFWYWGQGNHVDGSDHNATWGEEDHVKTQLAKMTGKFVDKGYPVIIGEYAAALRTVSENQEMHDKSVCYYGEVVTREAKNAGCVPFYWETGSVFNRVSGKVKRQDIIDGIIKGAGEGKYPF